MEVKEELKTGFRGQTSDAGLVVSGAEPYQTCGGEVEPCQM